MACSADCLAVGEPATGGKSDLYEFDGSPSRAVARDEASPRKRGGESIPHHHPALSAAFDDRLASVSFPQELASRWQSELARPPWVAA